jgi:hypothetical protein
MIWIQIMQEQQQDLFERDDGKHEHSGDPRKLYKIQWGRHNMHTRGKHTGEQWMRVCQKMNHHGRSEDG